MFKKIAVFSLILVAVFVIAARNPGAWGQEQKLSTPEQITETALKAMLNWKIKYGNEAVFAAEMQVLALSLEKVVRELEEKLRAANAKIAQLELKPDGNEDKAGTKGK